MKKLLSLILVFCLLLPLLGCNSKRNEILFYYPRQKILYGQEDSVITSEVRQATGREGNLTYLLMLYMEGPHNQALASPFPAGTTLEAIDPQENHLTVTLSDEFQSLQGMDHTIACACIAYTCFANTDFASVTIRTASQDASGITLTQDNIALADTGAAPQ